MNQNCKTCGWGRQIPNVKAIMKCECPLSGCFNTDVHERDGKNCSTWKKASDEYLRVINELR